ncbi:FH protein interacting protein FIP2 isoform X6 [Solanum tuberosum]|uniref:FH protein interacting protein FIP2 isoform X6 n=1 Tax=Solanum tuberosum TaxID=4113 RepID=UPI0003D2814D|nr:PREDICTED: FH protein interacting protein FIP2 isoform X6 [Solanum tuberosum]
MAYHSDSSSSMVRLNIGGRKFCTTLDTLTQREPDSMLAAMFSGRHTICQESEKGHIFVDRDGKHFRHILNWLRDGVIPPLKDSEYAQLLREAEYYQLLDLSFVDFSYACLKTVFFSRANLQCAKFRDVDAEASIFHNATLRELYICEFTGANLRGAVLAGANLQSANLQDACLIGCSFCGADLRSAHLQTADLTNANLEGANLEGANLKGAKLTNANLKGANLQRAYLRHVNLRDTHLEGAKLDGANLLGAIR